eukprot:TRINITY_DN4423_c0_g1_i2.p1 TRINITY_DN4423_c0_g1~~TRINITY_DN4423_c0_g1_i2.p1  ORF type:complete len:1454 (+),score=193.03 TRINITY_DN4423_c0_g1_i2:579-4364(+)
MNSWSVSALNLSGNKFKQQLETIVFSTWTKELDLSNNELFGTIPKNIPIKNKIDLSNNQISGTVPDLDIRTLNYLYLANNQITAINNEFKPSLYTLDLSGNKLTSLPTLNIFTLLLSNNQITGFNLPKFPLIKTLDLSHNKLTNIPTAIFSLSSLTYLNLSGNPITSGTLPSQLTTWKNVQVLELPGLGLSGTITQLEDLKALTSLNLSNNKLIGTIPSLTYRKNAMVTINLSNNLLTGIMPPDWSEKFDKIQVLNLSNNKITGTMPKTFASSSLREIDFSHNQFTSVSFPVISALKKLDLSFNDVSSSSLSLTGLNSDIRHLGLAGLKFSGTIPKNFSFYKNLTHLDLSHNLFNGDVPRNFFFMEAIQHLDLSFNKFTGTLPYGFVTMESLTYLNLQNNSYEGILYSDFFGALDNLETLDLSGNNWTQCSMNPPAKTSKLVSCNLGGSFWQGCSSPLHDICSMIYNNTCLPKSGFYGKLCFPCPNCVEPARCSDGYNHNGTCLTVPSACSLVNCEGPCEVKGDVGICTCPAPAQLQADGSCLCPPGYFKNKIGGSCTACSAVKGCASVLECSSPYDSKCSECLSGLYLDEGNTTCGVCEAIIGCASPVTCTSKNNTQCSRCIDERYLFNQTQCILCTPIAGCSSSISCTDANSSKCKKCLDGRYLKDENLCEPCSGIDGCTSPITCNNSLTSTCTSCIAGRFLSLDNSLCLTCPPITNCISVVECSSASSLHCQNCSFGYHLVKSLSGGNDSCVLNSHCSFTEWSNWSNCYACEGSTNVRQRDISPLNKALPNICVSDLTESKPCGFPCLNLVIETGDAALLYLSQNLQKYDWLQEQMGNLTIINITVTSSELTILARDASNKRQVTEGSCENGITQHLTNIVAETMNEILPNLKENELDGPSITQISGGCAVTISVIPKTPDSEKASSTLGMIIGGVIGGLFFLLAIALVVFWKFYYQQKLSLSNLPYDVRWFYEQYYKHPSSWKKEGSGGVAFYHKIVMKGSEHWDRLSLIFDKFCQGRDIIIHDAYAIYNPSLVSACVTQLQIMEQRMQSNPEIFKKKTYILEDQGEFRAWTFEQFQKRANECNWNQPNTPVILPAIHGTDFHIAWKICATGFANLSSLDDGFFGKGIYFTTYALYALPYFAKKERPAIIISFILPGNPFPVVENPNLKGSKVGTAIVSGYNSHYVKTLASGYPPPAPQENGLFDEIVVPQEAQIMPVFLLRLDTRNLASLHDRMDRVVLQRQDDDDSLVSLSSTLL